MSSPLTAEVVRRNSALFRHQRSRWFRNSYPSQGAALFPAELVIGAQGEIRIELQCPEICSVAYQFLELGARNGHRLDDVNGCLATGDPVCTKNGSRRPQQRVAPKAESRTDSPRSSLPNTNVSNNSALRPWRSRVSAGKLVGRLEKHG